MYSSYATFKYKMFAFDLGNTVLYSTREYSNLFLSNTNSLIDNILCTKSLVAIFAKDYSFFYFSNDTCPLRMAFSSCVAFSLFYPFLFFYLDIQSLLYSNLIYDNSSSIFALKTSHGWCLSVLKGLFVVCAIVQSI